MYHREQIFDELRQLAVGLHVNGEASTSKTAARKLRVHVFILQAYRFQMDAGDMSTLEPVSHSTLYPLPRPSNEFQRNEGTYR